MIFLPESLGYGATVEMMATGPERARTQAHRTHWAIASGDDVF